MMVTPAMNGGERIAVFGWGDGARGQLGSGDVLYRSRPQENRWLTKYMNNNQLHVTQIAAGGNHNLAICVSHATYAASKGQVHGGISHT